MPTFECQQNSVLHNRLLAYTYVTQTNNFAIQEYLSCMTTGYKIEAPLHAHFLTFQVIDWVDVFSRKEYRDIALQSLDFCRKGKGLQIWAYVIMTNHIHAILSARDGNLPAIIRDFKRFTATHIIKAIQTPQESRSDWMLKRFEFAARSNVRSSHHQFWTHENHAEVNYSQDFFIQKLTYIHMNPVRAGWVLKPEDWYCSSLRNYLGLPAPIEIDVMDFSICK